MRRPVRVAVALTLLAACSGGDDTDVVHVVAQPCGQPSRSFGLGVTVADGLVATAAHTVEGDLRTLTVDDAPATVAAIDPRTDLALLAVESGTAPVELSMAAPAAATLLGPAGRVDVRIVRSGRLVVDDTTDRRQYERDVHTFSPGVDHGTSGAPLVDEAGRVLGLVVLDNTRTDVAYAVTATEIGDLLERSAESTGSMVAAAGRATGRNTCDDR